MSKKNINVMACGCTVIAEENGKMTTSVDMLAKGISRLFAHSANRQAQNHTATARA